jgi:uncharacterized protein (DUF2236 family)
VELEKLVYGVGLLAGGANVIMQLARPGVGHGVVESRVEGGRLLDHPIKRGRTTLTYLSVATLGTETERKAYREAVNVAHRQVYSTPESPVKYSAMDPKLQLWVAACLYRGFEDSFALLGGKLDAATAAEVYREASGLGTTLQVREAMWPVDRKAFGVYWDAELAHIHIDDTVREYLRHIVFLTYLPKIVSATLGPLNAFVTTGFLPQEFRDQMRLPWSDRKQNRFEQLMRILGAIARHEPRVLREFPFNFSLWDLRRRLRTGRRLV